MITKLQKIRRIYSALYDHYGPQFWWPAKTSFEVIVGAYLTQNTSWNNVERALISLRKAGTLSVEGMLSLRVAELEKLIRSSGFFRQKARSLKAFLAYLETHHAGSLRKMFARHRTTPAALHVLRQELLELHGAGRETADSILLYAGNLPIFVVDAYTRRIFARHNIISGEESYEEIRRLVEEAFAPPKTRPNPSRRKSITAELTRDFNEMHALLVRGGKEYCNKSNPNCEACPLRKFLPRHAGFDNKIPRKKPHREAKGRRQ